MKYFVKAFPVDGRPKAGDLILYDGKVCVQHEIGYAIIMNGENQVLDTQVQIDSIKRIKLCLCSRDTQLGCILKISTDLSQSVMIHEKNIYHWNFLVEHEKETRVDSYYFSLIGDISSDVTWLNDLDEIEYTKLQFQISDPPPFEGWRNVYGINEFIKTPAGTYYKRIQIKGPCGHYH